MDYRSNAVQTTSRSAVVSRPRRVALSYQAVGLVVAAAEASVIVLGGAFGPLVYAWIAGIDPSGLDMTLGAGVLSSILYVSVARSAGLYRLPVLISPSHHIRRIAATCFMVFLALTAVLFLLKIGSGFSRGAMLGFADAMLVLCCVTRFGAVGIIESLLERKEIVGRPAFLLGEADELASLTPSMLLRQFGLGKVGRVALDPAPGHDGGGYRARIGEAIDLARVSLAQEFIVAAKFDRLERLTEIEEALRASPLKVRLVPSQVFRSLIARHALNQDASVYLIDLQRAPLSLSERAGKRVLDILFALVALTILSPMLIFAACAIKLDSPGPVIFRQRRNGFDQRQFVIYKFRTMTVLEDGDTVVQARQGDRRVTRIGRVLRSTSIDELPQLLNVLLGDMSLVGPRPHALAHDAEYKTVISDYSLRHHVKPGITGWAQINGLRGETARPEQMQRRIELDLWYINNWSLFLDVQILLRTAFEVIRHEAH